MVSCPVVSEVLSRLQWLIVVLAMFASRNLDSIISEKVAIIRRKITGERLSPCCTPVDCSISSFSFPIFSITERLV